MWTTLIAAVLLAQSPATPQPQPAPRPATNEPGKQGQAVTTKHAKTTAKDAPDPDLIGFLGDYEDAADGLDPIGLSESDAATQTAATKKNGHGP